MTGDGIIRCLAAGRFISVTEDSRKRQHNSDQRNGWLLDYREAIESGQHIMARKPMCVPQPDQVTWSGVSVNLLHCSLLSLYLLFVFCIGCVVLD